MRIDNKTVLIAGVITLGALGTLLGYKEALITCISGLVGYLSRDSIKLCDETEEIE